MVFFFLKIATQIILALGNKKICFLSRLALCSHFFNGKSLHISILVDREGKWVKGPGISFVPT